MRRTFALLALLLTGCIHTPRTEAQREITAAVRLEITHRLTLGKVTGTESGSCSGVAISHDLILTAGHCGVPHLPPDLVTMGVVGSIDSIVVFDYANQELCQAEVVKVDEAKDLALLRSKCWLPASSDVGLYEPPAGARVVNVAYPLGVEFPVMTEGFLTVTIHGGRLDGLVIGSFPVLPGSSGSPVFYEGAVVGIVSRGTPSSNHHIAMSASWASIRTFLAGVKM
jgi:hypothetical protein